MDKYPKYVYHKEYDEPRRVDNKAEEIDLLNKGWKKRYIKKEYPKWVNGVVVRSEAEEKLLLDAAKKTPKPKIEKKTVVSSAD